MISQKERDALYSVFEWQRAVQKKYLFSPKGGSVFQLPTVGYDRHIKAEADIGGWPNVRIILLMAFFVTSRHPCLFISA